jgi:NADH-quinone oxidoreductase subunit L
MTIPLIILAVLSIIGGFVGIPEVFMHGGERLKDFLSPVIAVSTEHSVSHSTEYLLMGLSTGLVLLAVLFAWFKYRNYKQTEAKGFGKILENKWYVDELYDKLIVNPVQKFAGFLNNVFEKQIIDGLVNGVGRFVNYSSRQLRLVQSGQVGIYVLLMVLSIFLLLVFQFFIKK